MSPKPAKASSAPRSTHCPNGHKLPSEGCTPLYCLAQADPSRGKNWTKAELKAQNNTAQGTNAQALASAKEGSPAHTARLAEKGLLEDASLSELPPQEKEALAKRLSMKVGQWAAKRALMNMPEGLEGGDAEEWAQKEGVRALPEAVAVLRYQLKYGDDKQQAEAARDFLDMNGMRRREQAGSAQPTVIVNIGSGGLPWMEKGKVIDAKVTNGEAPRVESGEVPTSRDRP